MSRFGWPRALYSDGISIDAKGRKMSTAIVMAYTVLGWVIASDGRETSDDDARIISDNERKIFPIQDRSKTLAYALVGTISNDADTGSGAYDLRTEAAREAESIAGRNFETFQEYVNIFAHHLKKIIHKAKMSGRINEYPENLNHLDPIDRFTIAEILLAGYFRKQPCFAEIKFYHREQVIAAPKKRFENYSPGNAAISGSEKIRFLMINKRDGRFSRYLKPLGPDSSLKEAGEFAKGYIEACSDPVALEIDPYCKGIGGHIHMATVTPSDGFGWLPGYEPENPA